MGGALLSAVRYEEGQVITAQGQRPSRPDVFGQSQALRVIRGFGSGSRREVFFCPGILYPAGVLLEHPGVAQSVVE